MYTVNKHEKYNYVTIVEIPMEDIKKIDFALCAQPTETPDAYYNRQKVKPDIITNGGFFSMTDGTTCFGLRDESVSIQLADYPGMAIVKDKQLVYGHNKTATGVAMRDFISAYPPLVEYGNKVNPTYAKELDYLARRTAVGWNNEKLFVVTVDNPGLKFSPLADIFVKLGAEFAINLDGGGSTRMLINGKRKTSQIYARPVDNVFCVYLNEPEQEKEYLYRVQVGAYSKKENAELMKKNLVKAGFTDAYVKLIGKYYKVQIGAYSVKLNADRMLDRVKGKGFNGFIVKEER